MSGGIPFDPTKFRALADYIWERDRPQPPERLASLMFKVDFEAYGRLGRSITGATWCRGAQVPYCREVGEAYFRRYVRSRIPWYARLLGWMLTAYAVAHATR